MSTRYVSDTRMLEACCGVHEVVSPGLRLSSQSSWAEVAPRTMNVAVRRQPGIDVILSERSERRIPLSPGEATTIATLGRFFGRSAASE